MGIIECMRYKSEELEYVKRFIGKNYYESLGVKYIVTKRGTYELKEGDWIVKGVDGDLHYCESGVFNGGYKKFRDLIMAIEG